MTNSTKQSSVFVPLKNSTYMYNSIESTTLRNLISQDFCHKNPLSVIEVENGIILPYKHSVKPRWGLGGVIEPNGTFVEESSFGYGVNRIFGGKYDYDQTKTIILAETVVYIGHIIDHWGSFLMDHISRLWYILPNPKKYRLAYCGIGFEPKTLGVISRPGYEFLSLLGISNEQLIDIRVPIRFKKVIIPQLSFYAGKFYTIEYKTIYEIARNSLKKELIKGNEKIYFTRRQFSKHKEIGEREIENFFLRNGFKILAPEKLKVVEQICYIKNCKILASIEGTIAHKVVFAGNAMVQQVILRKQSELNPRQHIFNQIADIPAIYIDVYYEPYKGFPISHDDGPFLLRFNTNLQHFADDNNLSYRRTFATLKDLMNLIFYTYMCLYKKYLHPVYLRLKNFFQPSR